MITDKERNTIDGVLDLFDANKVALVMEVLEWKWVNSEEKTPQPHEIRKLARKLLEVAVQSSSTDHPYTIATGGLEATCYKDDQGLLLTLKFVVESTDYDSDWINEEPPF